MGNHAARPAPPQFSAFLQRTTDLPHWHLDADRGPGLARLPHDQVCFADRKSTRLNSGHIVISYAVFCLKKKKKKTHTHKQIMYSHSHYHEHRSRIW